MALQLSDLDNNFFFNLHTHTRPNNTCLHLSTLRNLTQSFASPCKSLHLYSGQPTWLSFWPNTFSVCSCHKSATCRNKCQLAAHRVAIVWMNLSAQFLLCLGGTEFYLTKQYNPTQHNISNNISVNFVLSLFSFCFCFFVVARGSERIMGDGGIC